MSYRAFLLTWAALTVGAGCTNPRDRFDDFDVVDADTTEIDAPLVSTIPDVTGDWLLMAKPPVGKDIFLYFYTTVTYTPVTENTGTITVECQPLNWQTFEPVGDLITGEPEEVGADATFDWDLDGVIPPEANSVTGSNSPINGVVHGTILHADFMCGTLTGTAGALNLQGSLFGARRITGSELPEGIHRCEDAPPAP
jgi:hypothetical protein